MKQCCAKLKQVADLLSFCSPVPSISYLCVYLNSKVNIYIPPFIITALDLVFNVLYGVNEIKE